MEYLTLQNNKLDSLKNVDIENFNIDDLVDLRDIRVDKNCSVQSKIISFVEQIKNPYFFKVGNIAVKLNFDDEGPTFQERLLNSLKECSKSS